MELSRFLIAGAVALAVVASAPAAWAGGYQGRDETTEYRQPCPACPTCPTCPEVVEDDTWLRAELKGGVLMGVGRSSRRIDYGGMGEAVFGVKIWEDLDIEASYLFANNGVSNPGRSSGSQDMHCFRGGPRINGDVGPIELYGHFKMGYCNANASGSGFTDNSFVVGPGGGIQFTITPNLAITAGTDLIWFTGHQVEENTVITPNAGVRFKF
jgi:hypothetical protein